MSEFYEKNKKIIDSVIWFIFVLLFSILLPFLALTLGKGAEKDVLLEKVQSYYPFAIAFSIALVFMAMINHFVQKRKAKTGIYKYLGWVDGLINDYDSGIISEVGFLNFFKKIKWQIIVFLPFFVIAGYFGITQTGIPFAEQQVTETAETILAVEPAGSEMFILCFLISLVVGIFKYLAYMNSWEVNYKIISTPVSLVVGLLYGLAIHFLRYGNSDAKLFAVGIFWFSASLLIVVFGSIILAWIFKDINNMFQKLKALALSNDTIAILVGFIFGFIWFVILAFALLKKNKKEA